MQEWLDGFEHSSITDENRAAFNTSMDKYSTVNDAIVGGFNAQKLAGKPFRVPESLDKLPDDAAREDFRVKAHKLLGIEHVASIDSLSDINMKVGQADGAPFDENLATAFKQFVVDKKVPKSVVQDIVGFYNDAMGKATAAMIEKQETDSENTKKTTEEALIKHFGGKDEYLKQTELFTRAMKTKVGLTPEEVTELGDDLSLSKLTKHPALARIMLKTFAPLAATASTEGPGDGTPSAAPVKAEKDKQVAIDLGWEKAPV